MGQLLGCFKLFSLFPLGFATSLRFLIFLFLFGDLVLGLLQTVVLEVDHFLEREGLFGIAVTCPGVEDLGKLGLTYDGILDLTNCFVGKDDVALVDSEFEWQENDWDHCRVVLPDLDVLHLAVEGIWDTWLSCR